MERGALFRPFCICKVITTAHAHKSGVIFHIFQEPSNEKKIKALRPKMTKIATRGSCLNCSIAYLKILYTRKLDLRVVSQNFHFFHLVGVKELLWAKFQPRMVNFFRVSELVITIAKNAKDQKNLQNNIRGTTPPDSFGSNFSLTLK